MINSFFNQTKGKTTMMKTRFTLFLLFGLFLGCEKQQVITSPEIENDNTSGLIGTWFADRLGEYQPSLAISFSANGFATVYNLSKDESQEEIVHPSVGDTIYYLYKSVGEPEYTASQNVITIIDVEKIDEKDCGKPIVMQEYVKCENGVCDTTFTYGDGFYDCDNLDTTVITLNYTLSDDNSTLTIDTEISNNKHMLHFKKESVQKLLEPQISIVEPIDWDE